MGHTIDSALFIEKTILSDMNLSKLRDSKGRKPGVPQALGSQRVGHYLATEQSLLVTVCHFYDKSSDHIPMHLFLDSAPIHSVSLFKILSFLIVIAL